MIDTFFPQTPITDLYVGHALVRDIVPAGFVLWRKESNGFTIRTAATINARGATYITRQLPEITKGQSFDFELYGNVCIQQQFKKADGSLGKCNYQIPVYLKDAIKVWFLNRTFENGFAITDLDIETRLEVINRQSGVFEINCTKFSGSLIVSDEVKLKNAMHNGIGRGKAFGCALLSLT